jgi:pimeloyl-ACP methyl ester carboxylesterase
MAQVADEWTTVRAPDGRELEVLLMGDPHGFPLVYISGTPTAIAPYPDLSEAAAEQGLRVVGWSRPGYAGSTRREGRTVADAAEDAATILDALGHDRFVVLGWSGGGPHAIACAALLPDRCGAAASLAGVAPYDLMGEEWFRDMGKENVDEFRVAVERPQDLWALIEPQAPEIAAITGAQVVAMLDGLVDDVDRAVLTGEFAEVMAEDFRRGVSTGVAGWHDDDLAFARPWGFDLADITVPVSVWQGEHDLMVPFPHGQFLAAHIPTADAHLYPDEGHLSLAAQLPRILADLTSRAGV